MTPYLFAPDGTPLFQPLAEPLAQPFADTIYVHEPLNMWLIIGLGISLCLLVVQLLWNLRQRTLWVRELNWAKFEADDHRQWADSLERRLNAVRDRANRLDARLIRIRSVARELNEKGRGNQTFMVSLSDWLNFLRYVDE